MVHGNRELHLSISISRKNCNQWIKGSVKNRYFCQFSQKLLLKVSNYFAIMLD